MTQPPEPAKGRERLAKALQHGEPDRVPILLGVPECSIHQKAHENLLAYLHYEVKASAPIVDNILQIVEPDMRLHSHFDVDAQFLVPSEAPVISEAADDTYVDEFNRRFRRSGGFYNQVDQPLRQGTWKELALYRFPDLSQYDRVRGLADKARRLHAQGFGWVADGAVSAVIPDFIAAGIDGLNPVQYTAKGMTADRLKREFGRDLGFFGGGIDNEILSFGSVEQVESDVRRQVSELAPGGGYLFATIHNITPEAPPANVVACFRAATEFGKYPLVQQQ